MVIYKKAIKMSKFVEVNFVRVTLFWVLVVETVFISLFSFVFVFAYFITCNYWIFKNMPYIFTIFATTCCRIPNIYFFASTIFFWVFSLTSTLNRYSMFDSSYIFYYQTYINISMINVFLMFFIHLFLLSYWKHASLNLLYLEHTLLDKSSRVLKLSPHLPRLTGNK